MIGDLVFASTWREYRLWLLSVWKTHANCRCQVLDRLGYWTLQFWLCLYTSKFKKKSKQGQTLCAAFLIRGLRRGWRTWSPDLALQNRACLGLAPPGALLGLTEDESEAERPFWGQKRKKWREVTSAVAVYERKAFSQIEKFTQS